MKNTSGYTLYELLMFVGIMGLVVIGCTIFLSSCQQIATKNFGGSMTIRLDSNVKLVNVTWKDDHLWMLTTINTNEPPKTYKFTEKSVIGFLQGNVTIIEK